MVSKTKTHDESKDRTILIPSMYGIFTYIYDRNQPNVGRSTIHGCYEIAYTCAVPDVRNILIETDFC